MKKFIYFIFFYFSCHVNSNTVLNKNSIFKNYTIAKEIFFSVTFGGGFEKSKLKVFYKDSLWLCAENIISFEEGCSSSYIELYKDKDKVFLLTRRDVDSKEEINEITTFNYVDNIPLKAYINNISVNIILNLKGGRYFLITSLGMYQSDKPIKCW